MTVVVDASVIIALGQIGALGLLFDLFDRVIIPSVVLQEINAHVQSPEAIAVNDAAADARLEILEAAHPTASLALGTGERHVLALGLEHKPDAVLLDDRKARDVAVSFGLPVLGTIGVLLPARQRGLIDDAAPLVEQLRDHGFRISDELLDRVRGSSI